MQLKFLAILPMLFPVSAFAQEGPSFSTGFAKTINPGLIDCGRGSRVSAVGEITAEDGTQWTVPAATNYLTAPHAADLYNECDGFKPRSLADIDLDAVPVMDAGGDEVFTAFIFADNYFELYVNGKLLAVDAVPFTPFNSSIVKFRAERPLSIAMMGVDWEENLGLGSERGRGGKFSPGDAGVVAAIYDEESNVVGITDDSWKAQTFYTSPLVERDCLIAKGQLRDSSACDTGSQRSERGISAAYWPIPDGWYEADFDDADWPDAHTFSNRTVGINNKPGFTNFTNIFDAPENDPQFIWSSNLVLDNLVLLRRTFE